VTGQNEKGRKGRRKKKKMKNEIHDERGRKRNRRSKVNMCDDMNDSCWKAGSSGLETFTIFFTFVRLLQTSI
jgi:hypothetical protein